MQLYQHIAFTYISKLLRCVVYRKAKELKVLYGKPYILKIPIKSKVKILYERLIKRRLMNKTVLTVQSFNDYYNTFGESKVNPYLHERYRTDREFLSRKAKYLASCAETDYTLRIPSITQRILDDPNASSAARPKPERVDVTANELLVHLAHRISNKDIMEAASAVVNAMFDVHFSDGQALPQDFAFTPQDVQLYEALVKAGAKRHKAGTKSLTRAFQNIHSVLSKDKANLFALVDYEDEEMDKIKTRKFTFDEIIFFFQAYLRYAEKRGLTVDKSISHFFYYGFNKPWSPLLATYLAYLRHQEQQKKKKKSFGKDTKKIKPSRGYNTFPERSSEGTTYAPKVKESKSVTSVTSATSATNTVEDEPYRAKVIYRPPKAESQKGDTEIIQVSDTVRRRHKKQEKTPQHFIVSLLKRELEKIHVIKHANMDDESYERLADRLCTASMNYKTNPAFDHILFGAIGNAFVLYVKDRANAEGFRVEFMFSPAFMERFIGWAFRERYIVLANSGIGYKGQFDYTPQNKGRAVA